MKYIRQATEQDVSRIGEILVFNNRINFLPIFQDEQYSFGEMQVLNIARQFLEEPEKLRNTYVYDDGIVRGLICLDGQEVVKLYVDPFFQSRGIGQALLQYAVEQHDADYLWTLEKNVRGIAFYKRNGFYPTEEKTFEEGTTEYLVKLRRTVHN